MYPRHIGNSLSTWLFFLSMILHCLLPPRLSYHNRRPSPPIESPKFFFFRFLCGGAFSQFDGVTDQGQSSRNVIRPTGLRLHFHPGWPTWLEAFCNFLNLLVLGRSGHMVRSQRESSIAPVGPLALIPGLGRRAL